MVQVLATPEKVTINMVVPLEFTIIERKIEDKISLRRKRDKRPDAVAGYLKVNFDALATT